MTRKVRIRVGVSLAVIVFALVGAATVLVSCGGEADSGNGGATTTQEQTDQRAVADAAEPEPAMGSEAGAASTDSSGGASEAQYAAVPQASTPSAHYLMRTGDLALLVKRGALPSTVDRIKSMTLAMNGYVMSSSIGGETGVEPVDDGLDTPAASSGAEDSGSAAIAGPYADLVSPYAALTVRVPEQSFDRAIERFSDLGRVQSANTSSEDVTSQYVDLQARRRHYEAVERRLVGFLSETTNVNQMLKVQDRIDDVQLTIEELSAQLKSLGEQTTYATLSISVTERDSAAASVSSDDTFGGTLSNSIHLLGRTLRTAGLVLTALLPFLIVFGTVGVAIWYGVRRYRRGRRPAAPPPVSA